MGLSVGYPPSLEELYRQMSSSPAFAQMMQRQDAKDGGGGSSDPRSWLQARMRTHGLNIPPMPQQAAPPQQMPSQALGAPPQMPPQAPMPMGLPPMPQAQNRGSGGFLSGLIPEGGEFKERLGDMLMGFGGGSNINESLAMGGRAMAEGRRARAPLRAQTAQDNRTRQYAMQLGIPEDVAMGLDAANLMAVIREKYSAQNKPPGSDEYGLQPIVTQDETGKYHLFQASKSGGPPKEIPLPYGWTPTQQYLDLGPSFQAVPRHGVSSGASIPKDLAGAEAQKELGKQTGEAAALYASLSSKMPGLQKVIGELETLADQATYTQAGQAYNTARKELGISPTNAAVARAKYIAMVDNQVLPMLRDTFGAQFTVVEGESLRATLGDPNKTPEEKKAVLNAFIEQKVRNIEASAKQGSVDPAQVHPVPQEMPDVSTMSDEELEAIINGP